MRFTILFLCLFFIGKLAFADSSFLDLDNKVDEIITSYDENHNIDVCIGLSSLKDKEKKCFKIYSTYENSEGLGFGLGVSNGMKGQIIVDEHCCGIDKRYYLDFYKYDETLKNWVLYKSVHYGSIIVYNDNGFNYDVYSDENINRLYPKEYRDISGKKIEVSGIKEYTPREIKAYIQDLLTNKLKSKKLTFFELNEFLLLYPLTLDNIAQYNDIAFYLQKNNDHRLAIFLLEKVLKINSERIVAYLNLADSQFELDKIDDAQKNYEIYKSKMIKNNKQKRIPRRVIDRLKKNLKTGMIEYLNEGNKTNEKELISQTQSVTIQTPIISNNTPVSQKKKIHATEITPIKDSSPTQIEQDKTAGGSLPLSLLASLLCMFTFKLS